MPQVVYYKKQVGDLGAIFVRKHPLAPGLPGQPVSPSDLPVIVRIEWMGSIPEYPLFSKVSAVMLTQVKIHSHFGRLSRAYMTQTECVEL